jgi:hypothetical protein
MRKTQFRYTIQITRRQFVKSGLAGVAGRTLSRVTVLAAKQASAIPIGFQLYILEMGGKDGTGFDVPREALAKLHRLGK